MSERLEHRLVLCDYLYDLFGQEEFDDFQQKLQNTQEGFTEDGHSYFFHVLKGWEGLELPERRLAEYDLNIKQHVEKINRLRDRALQLKYFQYLAVLLTEVYLDKYCNQREEFLTELNEYRESWNAEHSALDDVLSFREADLDKLAFWMATGSGKTIIFHLNLHQFLHYNDEQLDNIILITPREELTQQHIEELRKSNITSREFEKGEQSVFSREGVTVEVIDIYKLSEKEGDKTVDVDAFEGNNLVFVDEGHKGSGGDVWMEQRDRVVSEGFVFEYSATFGQAINATNDRRLLEEYSKAILFDYSYNFFYQDGYGKDYRILNLESDLSQELTDTWLLGNLLSFYQQMRYYDDYPQAAERFNIERPLWIFVGGRVNAVYTRHGQRTSDVLTVLSFINRVLVDKDWAVTTLRKVLNGESELNMSSGGEVFDDQFKYLVELGLDAETIYADILDRLFHSDTASGLELVEMKEEDDEIGIRASSSDTYFGVVNIGDIREFLKLAEEHAPDIRQATDQFTSSLFDEIQQADSPLNLLLGSKKFIEGWDSWRVSNMGLMNVGKSEGSEVIQLFGRGVRLKGKDFSLKRSSTLPEESTPAYFEILETLNIFGVQADYMQQFKHYLEEEGIEPEYWTRDIEVRVQDDLLDTNLKVPRVGADESFKNVTSVSLELETAIQPTVDLRPEIEVLDSNDGEASVPDRHDIERQIPGDIVPLLDWDAIYFDLLQYKRQNDLENLSIGKDVLRAIIDDEVYTLYCPASELQPESFSDVDQVQRVVEIILKSYVDNFYSHRRQAWESERLTSQSLDIEDENFPAEYTISIPQSKDGVIETVDEVISEANAMYEQEVDGFPSVYFDKHLYQPLLTEDLDFESIQPTGLNSGERRFVEDLREFVQSDWSKTVKSDQLFLLRNLAQRGIGFFEAGNFYPDFILWITGGDRQHIVFVDPKGLQHIGVGHEKIQFYETIKEIEDRLDNENIILDSFIVSNTSPADAEDTHNISQEEFEDQHVLFQDEHGVYVEKLISKIGHLK